MLVHNTNALKAIRKVLHLNGHNVKVWHDKRKADRRIKIGVCCVEGRLKLQACLSYMGITFQDAGDCFALPTPKHYTPHRWQCVTLSATHDGYLTSTRTPESLKRAA